MSWWRAPKQVLINDWFDQFYTHTVGTIVFGPDGYLYAGGGGDGAEAAYADYGQTGGNPAGDPVNERRLRREARIFAHPTTRHQLDGSIIRIDPQHRRHCTVTTNPLYVSGNDANAKLHHLLKGCEIRSASPSAQVRLKSWAGDTGWNTWEEIDRITNASGGLISRTSAGRRIAEGPDQQSGLSAQLNLPILNNLYADPTGGSHVSVFRLQPQQQGRLDQRNRANRQFR